MSLVQHICKFFFFWLLCLELVLSFACFYFLVSPHFIPFEAFQFILSNLAYIEKNAAGNAALTLLRYTNIIVTS